MAGENVPVRFLPGGSTQEVASSGSIVIKSAGSVQVESGGVINVAAGGSIINAGGQAFTGTISIGGTVGRWAFGSAALDTGTALVYTGLTTIVAVHASPIKASPGTATTSPSSFQIDASRFAQGTFYALGLQGTFNYGGAGTFTWQAHGY